MRNPIPAPVAPEFILTLQDNAEETVVACLKSLKVPQQVIDLVQKISILGYYLQECEAGTNRNPEIPFGIEELTIQTINLVAECGGVFHFGSDETAPREVFTPVKKITAKDVLKDKRLTWEIVNVYLEANGLLTVDKAEEEAKLERLIKSMDKNPKQK